MKYLLALFLLTSFLFSAEKLIIDAENFETNDSRGITLFSGNVKLSMGKDKLNSQKLEIFMKANTKGKAKTPLKYVASGDASFEIHSKGKIYKGKGDKVTYNPKTQEYKIVGNGKIEETVEGRELYGETIYINQLTGNARVQGTNKKPVRFIIDIDNGDKK